MDWSPLCLCLCSKSLSQTSHLCWCQYLTLSIGISSCLWVSGPQSSVTPSIEFINRFIRRTQTFTKNFNERYTLVRRYEVTFWFWYEELFLSLTREIEVWKRNLGPDLLHDDHTFVRGALLVIYCMQGYGSGLRSGTDRQRLFWPFQNPIKCWIF